jgi:Tfp pilus assembly protein PilP
MRVKTALCRVRECVAMKRSLSIVLLLGTLLSACGESDEEQAQDAVCDARAGIQKQVDELSGLTLDTATAASVGDSLIAIRDDLEQIAEAQGDLNDERKQEVESANKEFTSQLQSITKELTTSLSASGAKEQFQAAVTQLADTYRQSFAGVDCS